MTKKEANIINLQKAVAARVANGRTVRNCKGCKKECSVTISQIRKGWKYCSWGCRVKNMVGENGSNANGGKWMIGENNINYRHGKSSQTMKRDLGMVGRWRRRIFERDKYICQRCGYDKGKTLRAHHIYPWSMYVEKRFDLNNGITLCDSCHRWVHSKKNTNREYICK